MKNNIEHFYVEMIPVPTLKESNLSISYLGILSQALEIPPVITSDAHFPRPEDYWLQSILSCVSVRKRMDDPTNTVKLESYMYYGSREELEDRFNQAILINEPNIQKDLAKIGKTGLDNTYAISEMCNVEIPTANKIYAGGLDTSPDQALYNLIHAGFVNRCNEGLIPEEKRNEYWQRAMYELSVLKAKQFFCRVYSIAKYQTQQNRPPYKHGRANTLRVFYKAHPVQLKCSPVWWHQFQSLCWLHIFQIHRE